jgi:hypothetical protein
MDGWGDFGTFGVAGALWAPGSDGAFGVPGNDGAFGELGGAGRDGALGGLGGLGAVGVLLTPAQAAVPLSPRARAGTTVRSFFDRATLHSCIGVASSYDVRRRPPVRQ